MSEFFCCTVCGEVVEGSDPCACVFDAVGVIDSEGVLHTAKRVSLAPLAQALAAFNAERRSWIAEDPTQRWGTFLTEDLAHWARYGIRTPEELAEYLDQCAEHDAAHDWDDDWDEQAEAEAAKAERRAQRDREKERVRAWAIAQFVS